MDKELESYKDFAKTIVHIATRESYEYAIECVADEIEQYTETKISQFRDRRNQWEKLVTDVNVRLKDIELKHKSAIPINLARLAKHHIEHAYAAFKIYNLKTSAIELEYARKLSDILGDSTIEVALICLLEQES